MTDPGGRVVSPYPVGVSAGDRGTGRIGRPRGGEQDDQHIHRIRSGGAGYSDRRSDHLRRLRKVEGQVRGITRMVEGDRYCIDVLTQVSAVTRALQQVALGLLDDHLRHCVLDAARAGTPEATVKFDELNGALRQALRL